MKLIVLCTYIITLGIASGDVDVECGMAGAKMGKLDHNQPCSAASLAIYEGSIFCAQDSTCLLCRAVLSCVVLIQFI